MDNKEIKKIYYNSVLEGILHKRMNTHKEVDMLISAYFYYAYIVFIIEYGFWSIDSAGLSVPFGWENRDNLPSDAIDCFNKIDDILMDYETNRKNEHQKDIVREDLKKMKDLLRVLSQIVTREYKDLGWWLNGYIEI